MDRSDASALVDLQMHWDEAYDIRLDGATWSARFHGSAQDLRASSASELRELIRADYTCRTKARAASAVAADAAGDVVDEVEDDQDEDEDDFGYGARFGYGSAGTSREGRGSGQGGTRDTPGPDAGRGPGTRSETDAGLGQQPGSGSFAAIKGERMST